MNKKSEDQLFINTFVVGLLTVNCYLLADLKTKEACLIDPGGDAKKIKDFLTRNGFDLKFIIITHGHGDHIGANKDFGVPIYIHKLDKDFLTDPDKNLSGMFSFAIKSPPASGLLEDGDIIELGRFKLEVIHTPGHTPGSISLKCGNIVFTGDTLFNGSVGRTDLSYGDEEAILKSIIRRLMALDDDTVVYPGHGGPSTIGEERSSNPFLT